jgi:hypothetical protein
MKLFVEAAMDGTETTNIQKFVVLLCLLYAGGFFNALTDR